jgi:cytosine/adenosine deaminase-related metal-dependent hydrolase
MTSTHSILLQNATLLVPESLGGDRIVPIRNHSLLIEGNIIVRIAAKIDPPSASTEVIDCTSKLISPGFIDTHHHVWQTQLKGRHSDHTLFEYMTSGMLHGFTKRISVVN